MPTPKIILNYSPLDLAEQLSLWRDIVAQGQRIEEHITSRSWQLAMDAAEHRQQCVDSFFDGGICLELIAHIMVDIEMMKLQLDTLKSTVNGEQADVEAHEQQLIAIRNHLKNNLKFSP